MVTALIVMTVLLAAAPAWAQPGAVTNVTVAAKTAGVSTIGMTIPDTSGGIETLFINETNRATLRDRYNADPSAYDYPGPALANCLTATTGSGCDERAARQLFAYRIQDAPRTCGGTVAAGTVIDNCQEALAWLAACYTADCWPNEEDAARYHGENVIFSVNWAWELLTPTERTNWTNRIIARIGFAFSEQYGDGCHSPFSDDRKNNYSWGFTRNAFHAGVMYRQYVGHTMPSTGYTFTGYGSWNWNSDDLRDVAQEILENFDCRVDNLVSEMNSNRGGGMFDGRMYGQYLQQYYASVMVIAQSYGRNLLTESPWWVDSIWNMLFSTTPKAAYHRSASGAFTFQLDSYGATNLTYGRATPDTLGAGDFFTVALRFLDGTPIEPYARHFLTNRLTAVHTWLAALDDDRGAAGTALSAGGFTPDFWALGFGKLIARTTWTPTSAPFVWYFNLGQVYGNHRNVDAGSFQILGCGTGASSDCYWGLKEASCYGFSTPRLPNTLGSVETADHPYGCYPQWGQNVVSVNHELSEGVDPVVIGRLDRKTDYIVGSSDLAAYNNSASELSHVRTFVFVRPRNYAIALDRISTSSSATPKVWTMRCPVTFSNPATGQYRCTMGAPTIVVDHFQHSAALSSQSVAYTTRDESGGAFCASGGESNCDPQFRVEASVTGSTSSYILSTTFARLASADAPSAPTIDQSGGVITVTVVVGGVTDVITFTEGMTDAGCSINLNGAGAVACDTGVDTVTSTSSTYSWD